MKESKNKIIPICVILVKLYSNHGTYFNEQIFKLVYKIWLIVQKFIHTEDFHTSYIGIKMNKRH